MDRAGDTPAFDGVGLLGGVGAGVEPVFGESVEVLPGAPGFAGIFGLFPLLEDALEIVLEQGVEVMVGVKLADVFDSDQI
ncbi:MAG: hypothetical protein ABEN55_14550 [Bradymonadaceae bacterium]